MNTPETLDCHQCAASFEWTNSSDRYQLRPRLCGPCAAIEIGKNHQAAIAKAEAEILNLTPPRYQATDTGHPDFNLKLWERVKTWKPTDERPWLGMAGPTGASKTRCAFLTLREIALGMIRPAKDPDASVMRPSIAVVSAYKFAEAVALQFTDEKAVAVAFLHRLRAADLLVMDDLGKQRNTPAVASELFALLDHRHAENLPTLWTSNTTPEGIVAGMPDDMAAPLSGRIRECSTIINLS